jgi:hypothetical protein
VWISRKQLEELEDRIDKLDSEFWFLKGENKIWWNGSTKRWHEDIPPVYYDHERESVAMRRILTMLLNHFGLCYEEDAAKLVKKTKKA